MGHLGSKSRSIGQIIEKSGVQAGDHNFRPIIIKFGQNVCLGKILD